MFRVVFVFCVSVSVDYVALCAMLMLFVSGYVCC